MWSRFLVVLQSKRSSLSLQHTAKYCARTRILLRFCGHKHEPLSLKRSRLINFLKKVMISENQILNLTESVTRSRCARGSCTTSRFAVSCLERTTNRITFIKAASATSTSNHKKLFSKTDHLKQKPAGAVATKKVVF